jgi:hypothetical protein
MSPMLEHRPSLWINRGTGHNPPRGPSAGWRVITTAIAAGTSSLTCLPNNGGARDNKFLVTHLMTDQRCLTSVIARRNAPTYRDGITILGWVTQIYYLELLCASEGTLSCWSQLHLQSLTSTPVSRMVDVRQATGRKNNCRFFPSQHDEKHIVPTPLSGIRVGKEEKK